MLLFFCRQKFFIGKAFDTHTKENTLNFDDKIKNLKLKNSVSFFRGECKKQFVK